MLLAIAIVIPVAIIATYAAISHVGMEKESLKSAVAILNVVTISAVGVTFIAAIFLFFFQDRLAQIQESDIAQANATAQQAHTEAVRLDSAKTAISLELEKQKHENLLMRKAISDRHINIDAFAQALLPYAGTTIVINSASDQGETQLFAFEVQDAFRKAHWIEKASGSRIGIGGPPMLGLLLSVNGNELGSISGLEEKAHFIVALFAKYGIPCEFIPNHTDFNFDALVLEIGFKPSPYASDKK